MEHRTTAELEAGIGHVRAAPRDAGTVELIVVRPDVGERAVLDEAQLDATVGVVGDSWSQRSSSRTGDGSPHPDMQLNVMSARVTGLLAPDRTRWPLAGDQLYLDLDLSQGNAPAGTRLALGSAVIEVTDQPHRGCAKFSARFGRDALRFVSAPQWSDLRLRGINARVVEPGTVRRGDAVTKL